MSRLSMGNLSWWTLRICSIFAGTPCKPWNCSVSGPHIERSTWRRPTMMNGAQRIFTDDVASKSRGGAKAFKRASVAAASETLGGCKAA